MVGFFYNLENQFLIHRTFASSPVVARRSSSPESVYVHWYPLLTYPQSVPVVLYPAQVDPTCITIGAPPSTELVQYAALAERRPVITISPLVLRVPWYDPLSPSPMRREIVVLPARAYELRVSHSPRVGRRYPVAQGPTFHDDSRVCFPIHSRAVLLPLIDTNDDSRSQAKNQPVFLVDP